MYKSAILLSWLLWGYHSIHAIPVTREEFNTLNNPNLYPEQSKAAKGQSESTDQLNQWPDGIIYYTLKDFNTTDDDEYQHFFEAHFASAIAEIEALTCIRFLEHNFTSPASEDFVRILDPGDETCSSFIGKKGGSQDLNLGRGCHHHATIAHQLIHVIGFDHQQNRPDRGDYVAIVTDNIEPEFQKNFEISPLAGVFNTTYDFDSIMHYNARGFGRTYKDGQKGITILPHDMSQLDKIGTRMTLSYGDWKGIANMYCPSYNRLVIQTDEREYIRLYGSGYIEDGYALETPSVPERPDHVEWYYEAAKMRNTSVGSTICNWESELRQKTCLVDDGIHLVYAPGSVNEVAGRWYFAEFNGNYFRKIQNLKTGNCIRNPHDSDSDREIFDLFMVDCRSDSAWWYVYIP